MIKNIAITGGVHGNELTGAYLVNKWQKKPIKTENIDIKYILANPKAFKFCRRYIDYDLNRSFSKYALLEDSHLYEFERAKVLKERLKKKDFLIDLHTTTANMKMTIVLSKDDEISNYIAKSKTLNQSTKVSTYDIVKIVDFPREKEKISAMIHPDFIGKDYTLIKKGDPIFLDFDGKEIVYEDEPMYAVFINEAAYYEKKMAFCLCKKGEI